ncbi:MAG: VWA domain-containing protein [Microcystis aeruginosa DA14]|uniref:VWA domain-containing protein n=1 Tax=Microcystis aeruginosa DA14 TaxID=1987506 RepID=A0A3E0LTZ5_MICAE|nr:MAG: VWA domain-containing protein [Microcystis aeruginosa DA14]
MIQTLRNLRRNVGKPLLFGFYGAIGCLIAALFLGEPLLYLTRLPPTIHKNTQEIVLLIDCSGSMDGSKLDEVKAAASRFVQRQDLTNNRLAVMGFGSEVHAGSPLTSNASDLETAIANLNDGGGTKMDQALLAATEQFSPSSSSSVETAVSSSSSQHILLFTDGQPGYAGANMEEEANKTLAAGQQARSAGIHLVTVGTGDADNNFLGQLTGDPALVFYAGAGNLDSAFQEAEKVIKSYQLVESESSGDYGSILGALRIGGWTGLLALGTSLSLIVGQNYYLRRRLLSWNDLLFGLLEGFVAGAIAGSSGQLLYTAVSGFPVLGVAGRLAGWTILGCLVGVGMSFFVPNLKLDRALIGGAAGGIGGAIGFLLAAGIFGEIGARLIGAGILGFFIGLMIAWMEQISRQAKLIVHWTPKEQTTLTLGEQPIIVGSSRQAHVYLPQAQGFFATTARIYQEGATIVMQYDTEYGQAKGMKKLRHELNDGDRRQFGQLILEIQTSSS